MCESEWLEEAPADLHNPECRKKQVLKIDGYKNWPDLNLRTSRTWESCTNYLYLFISSSSGNKTVIYLFFGQNFSFTQVVLETVAGLVGVGKAGVERGRPVILDLLLHLLRHFYWICKRRNESFISPLQSIRHNARTTAAVNIYFLN